MACMLVPAMQVAELRPAASGLYLEARAAAPGIELDETVFVELLLKATAGAPDQMAALEAIHVSDLFVAHAAAAATCIGDDAGSSPGVSR